jgi:hypothetical protein
VNANLLRAKMALKGDYDLTPLMDLLGLSRPAVTARVNGEVDWKLPEMRKIIRKYEFTEVETCDVFELR